MQLSKLKNHFLSASAGIVFAGEFNQVASDFTGVSTDSLNAITNLYSQAGIAEMAVGSATLLASATILYATARTCKRGLFSDQPSAEAGPA